MPLPNQSDLPVNLLAASFNDTSTTYKYYWLISIIQFVELETNRIRKKDLFARMIANAWYTINYFRISFGPQDKLQRAVEKLMHLEKLTIDADRELIFNTLIHSNNQNTTSHLNYFNSQVPHWFLSPWLRGSDKATIYRRSQSFDNKCLYALSSEEVTVNPDWIEYLQRNSAIIKDFCWWNLAIYLQKRNPNVPDIPSKLIKPAKRNGLIKQRKFWDIVFTELATKRQPVECIYTGQELTISNYAVEHFIPYAFVSHDLIWNLVPAQKAFNSSKSDKLPPMDRFFDPFFEMQQIAFNIVREKSPGNEILNDYLTIFPNLDDAANPNSKERFRDQLQPLVRIALNNGFEYFNGPIKQV